MKTNYKIYIAIIAICISSISQGQEQHIINIGEIDEDGRSIDKETGEIKESYINTKIVDINSVLDITLDKTLLTSKISKDPELPTELSEKISELHNALKNREENLKAVQTLINSYDFDTFERDAVGTQAYFNDLSTIVKKVDDITYIDDRIEDLTLKYDDKGPFGSVYFAAEEVLNELTKEVEEIATKNGVYVQFGGWIVAGGRQTPLNIPGYDDIKPQDPFQVDRWQLLPSPEQLEQLEDLQKLAKDNRGKEDEIIKSIAKNHLDQMRGIIDATIRTIQDKIDEEIEKVKEIGLDISEQSSFDTLKSDIDEVKMMIKNLKEELIRRKEFYTSIVSNPENIALGTFLSNMQNDITYIKNEGKLLLDKINSVSTTLTGIVGDFGTKIESIKEVFSELKTHYTGIYNKVKNTISSRIEQFLYGQKLDFAALKFSEEVYKFTLDKLPQSSTFDLINSGVRKDGDQLAFKLEVTGKDGVIYTENRKISMFRVLPHVEGTVGVIFADPLARTSVETQFQLAPYYNVIFKGFLDRKARRKSITYNRLLDWGVGLHVSAPDFDGDDVPELGAGVVVSILNDYVQSGIAVNVFTGDPYWFFGLRLPVPSFNIGNVRTNN
ncbi:hypothetical protein GCM10011344_02690 [Dokdonia pacifica]|uniref:Uncharacterized protein n=1 Tax=Dokdonia pacifica TaxID=1627892 RepID=A0A238ZDQ4_9FLAO|nr:hypothetical protein [Dokdonia pacifica]GGG05672.1 hypothetical protein GCM10011344_02690 [Dokdonia pacifica]SNR81229.1 hypothetical protein SAMN06265376_103130 [Dokdonia pacifica]